MKVRQGLPILMGFLALLAINASAAISILAATNVYDPLIPQEGLFFNEQKTLGLSTVGTFTVSGKIEFIGSSGMSSVKFPARQVKIELLDRVGLLDVHLAWGSTRDDGSYEIIVDDADVPLSNTDEWGTRDISIKVYAEVRDVGMVGSLGLLGSTVDTYVFQSDVRWDIPDGSYQLDIIIDSKGRGSLALLSDILDVYNWLNPIVGQPRNLIKVVWPDSRTYTARYIGQEGTPQDSISLPSVFDFQTDEMRVYHEYAHAIMYAAYDGNMPHAPLEDFPDYDGDGVHEHYLYSQSALGVALNEGWAEFLEAASNLIVNKDQDGISTRSSAPGPSIPQPIPGHGDTTIESNQWWLGEDAKLMQGQYEATPFGERVFYNPDNNTGDIVEGAVASILWDIFDASSDDDDGIRLLNNEGFKQIWNIMSNDKPQNINEFWQAWIDRDFPNAFELRQIFADHGILKESPSRIVPILTEPGDPSYEAKIFDIVAEPDQIEVGEYSNINVMAYGSGELPRSVRFGIEIERPDNVVEGLPPLEAELGNGAKTATFRYIPPVPGTYNIRTAILDPVYGFQDRARRNNTFTVNQIGPPPAPPVQSVALTATPSQVNLGQMVKLTATLIRSDGSAAEGEQVVFSSVNGSGAWTPSDSAVTDSIGKASVDFKVTSIAGTHAIVDFKARTVDGIYGTTSITVTAPANNIDITVVAAAAPQRGSTVTVYPYDATVTYGGDLDNPLANADLGLSTDKGEIRASWKEGSDGGEWRQSGIATTNGYGRVFFDVKRSDSSEATLTLSVGGTSRAISVPGHFTASVVSAGKHLPGHALNQDSPHTLAWSSTGDRLATLKANEIVVWDGALRTVLVRSKAGAEYPVFWALAWSPDGSELAIVDNGLVRIISSATGQLRITFGAPNTRDVAWSPTGDKIASTEWVDGTGKVKIWDTSGNLLRTLAEASNEVFGVSWSPRGSYLAAGWWKADEAKVWRTSDWSQVSSPLSPVLPRPTGSTGWRFAWKPDESRLAVGWRTGQGHLAIYDPTDATGQKKTDLALALDPYDVDWSHDGKFLVVTTVGDSEANNILDSETLAPQVDLNPSAGVVDISPDDRLIAIGVSGEVLVYSPSDTTAPNVRIDKPVSGTVLAFGTQTMALSGRVSDENLIAWAEGFVNGNTVGEIVPDAAGAFEISVGMLNVGDNVLSVQARDVGNNRSEARVTVHKLDDVDIAIQAIYTDPVELVVGNPASIKVDVKNLGSAEAKGTRLDVVVTGPQGYSRSFGSSSDIAGKSQIVVSVGWPTSGLVPGTYTVAAAVTHTSDETPSSLTTLLELLPAIGSVRGRIFLQGRAEHGGVSITLGARHTTTQYDGMFSFDDVDAGYWTVVASAIGYLPATRTGVKVEVAQTTDVGETILLTGDLDGNKYIDILDLSRAGIGFGKSPVANQRADINGDGTVDISDMTTIASNYGKSTSPWTEQPSPIAHWRFDGNADDGTLNGGPAFVSGVFGQAISFDGQNDWVSFQDKSQLDGMTELTLDLWLYLRAYPPSIGGRAGLVTKWGPLGREDDSYSLSVGHEGELVLAVSDGGSDSTMSVRSSNVAIPLSRWVRVTATWETPGNIHLYLNGHDISGDYYSGTGQNTQKINESYRPVDIGMNASGMPFVFLNAMVDEVRMFNVVKQPRIDTLVPLPPSKPQRVGPTNDHTPAFTWDVAVDIDSGIRSYELSIDDGAFIDVGNGLTYTVPVDNVLADGPHKFRVRAIDNADNVGPEASLDFIVDESPLTGLLAGITPSSLGGTTANTQNATDHDLDSYALLTHDDGTGVNGLQWNLGKVVTSTRISAKYQAGNREIINSIETSMDGVSWTAISRDQGESIIFTPEDTTPRAFQYIRWSVTQNPGGSSRVSFLYDIEVWAS